MTDNIETPETPEDEEQRRQGLYDNLVDFLGEQGYELESEEETGKLLGWLMGWHAVDIDATTQRAVRHGIRIAVADIFTDDAAMYAELAEDRRTEARRYGPKGGPIRDYTLGKAAAYDSLVSVCQNRARDLRDQADQEAETDG